MVGANDQLRERAAWFWHGHFATSIRKVRMASLMLRQNQTLRRLALGHFPSLAQAMIIDPAMLRWLDGNDNTSKAAATFAPWRSGKPAHPSPPSAPAGIVGGFLGASDARGREVGGCLLPDRRPADAQERLGPRSGTAKQAEQCR
jgi:hypothetical protein